LRKTARIRHGHSSNGGGDGGTAESRAGAMSFTRRVLTVCIALALCSTRDDFARAKEKLPPTLSKGHHLLIDHGLQIQGMASSDDAFHLETYAALNYTAINCFSDGNPRLMGPPPG